MYAIIAAIPTLVWEGWKFHGQAQLDLPSLVPVSPVKNQDPLAKILTSKILKFYWTLISLSLWPRDI